MILFLLLCVGNCGCIETTSDLCDPRLLQVARNAFIVLALIIPVITGLGLNLIIVVGAMAAQITLFLTYTHPLTGVLQGWRLFITVALATYCAGVRLPGRENSSTCLKGNEMIAGLILGYFADNLFTS